MAGNNAGFVGATTCASCHVNEAALWKDSHHDLAMQPATADTVLGDFNSAHFIHNDVDSRFLKRGEEFFVATDGADGKLAEFPVRYTFGVTPLQQYIVEMPNGKLQTLGIAWDSRARDAGGQRWFHVYGDEPIDHTDVLHWTRFSQNWETMCADCHSTNLLSQYQIDKDQFKTTWAELDVSCEACHGAGAEHVAWARDKASAERPPHAGFRHTFDERDAITWRLDATTGNSQRSKPRSTSTEIDACAGCHSRRSRIADSNDPAQPFLDNYSPALIDPPLYYPDGQMLDEVYIYGSFLQSRMHQAGVTCSDCHDPHSLRLRAPGPAVCSQCHAPEKFSTVAHQMHEPETVNCIDCHMPATVYMQNDARHDHSLRIPRPDLSIATGIPNACNNCHTDRDAEWTVAALRKAGRISPDTNAAHWSSKLAAAAQPSASSTQQLADLATDGSVPVIIRATAASRLSVADTADTRQLFTALSQSQDPLVRLGIAQALQNSEPSLAAAIGPALLGDSHRAVRIAAAENLAGVDPTLLPTGSQPLLLKGIDEYIASQEINNERPEAHVNIANLRRNQGRFEVAEPAYRQALAINPLFIPAYANLADLYREWQRENDAEATLRAGLNVVPGDANLHHALGLSLVRQNRLADALPELQAAAESADTAARFGLVYALALDGAGHTAEAIRYLQQALKQNANDAELQNALAEMQSRSNGTSTVPDN